MKSKTMIPVVPEAYDDVCRTVEAICEKFPSKYWRALEDAPLDQRYPESWVSELEQAGILGAGVDEAHGGIELPIGALARIIETINACGATGDVVAEQLALSLFLRNFGSDSARDAVLPLIAEGSARFQSIALWESGAGRDTARISTTAKRTAEGYVIEGTKRWVRFVAHSRFLLVLARTGEAPGEVSLFLVDLAANTNKFRIAHTAAMNNFVAAEVTFNGVVVPEGNLIGTLHGGAVALGNLDTIRAILTAAAAAGCSRFFTRKGVAYANERIVFGNPIGSYQGIQFPLAQTYMESQGAGLLMALAIALQDSGQDCYVEARMAHHMSVQAAWDTAEAAFSTHGGFAFAREYDVERKWREVRVMRNDTAAVLHQVSDTALGTSSF